MPLFAGYLRAFLVLTFYNSIITFPGCALVTLLYPCPVSSLGHLLPFFTASLHFLFLLLVLFPSVLLEPPSCPWLPPCAALNFFPCLSVSTLNCIQLASSPVPSFYLLLWPRPACCCVPCLLLQSYPRCHSLSTLSPSLTLRPWLALVPSLSFYSLSHITTALPLLPSLQSLLLSM